MEPIYRAFGTDVTELTLLADTAVDEYKRRMNSLLRVAVSDVTAQQIMEEHNNDPSKIVAAVNKLSHDVIEAIERATSEADVYTNVHKIVHNDRTRAQFADVMQGLKDEYVRKNFISMTDEARFKALKEISTTIVREKQREFNYLSQQL